MANLGSFRLEMVCIFSFLSECPHISSQFNYFSVLRFWGMLITGSLFSLLKSFFIWVNHALKWDETLLHWELMKRDLEIFFDDTWNWTNNIKYQLLNTQFLQREFKFKVLRHHTRRISILMFSSGLINWSPHIL